MSAYYNEWDRDAAAWLRELIKQGHIAPGDVDERSITDVKPEEIRGYTQWHFFAGIGGWSLALRQAGWADDRPVLTGSPPCQPFSTAGQQRGYADDRHLAPVWLDLVKGIRPAFVFAEQVAAAINKHDWLDDLLDGLEAEGYATGAVVLPACGVGAPHIRQRLWVVGRLGDSEQPGLEGHAWDGERREGWQETAGSVAETSALVGLAETGWDDPDWLYCRDKKCRPVESGTFPLADGIPARVGRLRGYGNAIVPQVATEIIKEVM